MDRILLVLRDMRSRFQYVDNNLTTVRVVEKQVGIQCPLLCLLIVVVPTLAFAPLYAAVIIRGAWGDVAWTNTCNGWDITAVVQGVNRQMEGF